MNGTLELLPKALDIICRLFGLALILLVCVIDGLQKLYQLAIHVYIEKLLTIL